MFQIMVVEDDDLLRSLFVRILKKNGYNTSEAGSGQLALEYIAKNHISSRLDIIYSDVRMPNGDGIEFLSALKKNGWLPRYFVFITGHADLTINQTKSLGAHDILEKPIEFNDFLNYTKNLLT